MKRELGCAAGRPDAGVHALAQIAHLDIHSTLPPETLRRRINDELPADINILLAEKVRQGDVAAVLGDEVVLLWDFAAGWEVAS